MAPKDYVKRSQNISRKKRNTKTKEKKPMPWLKIFLAFAVVGGFAFSLYQLANLDLDNSNNTLNEKNASSPIIDIESRAKASSEDELLEEPILPPLPKMGKEEWDYIDSLPDFEVEVDTTGPLESDRQFVMQCGSFRTETRAEELKAKLAFQGMESRVLESNGTNGLWYRVVLGPYDKKRDAERARHQLRQADIRGCKIW